VGARAFRFHPAAAAEFADAAEWYESRRSGLGHEFVNAIRNRVEDIRETPERWALAHSVRRALVTKFPYAVVYRELADGEIQIIAVAHLRRRPKYWARR
jgi:plasmid stabilization system protein ParE